MTSQTPPDFIGVDLARETDRHHASAARIYIAGPMSGYPELNFPAFHAEASALRALGHTVVNPAEINTDPAAGWAACMRDDIAQLITCQRLHLLPGWSTSKGASLEHHIGRSLGMLITLAEGAESLPEHFGFGSLAHPEDLTAQLFDFDTNTPTALPAQSAAAGPNVCHLAAIALCERIAAHHQHQLNDALHRHGYHTANTQAHGYQYLGARRCIEALRIAARQAAPCQAKSEAAIEKMTGGAA